MNGVTLVHAHVTFPELMMPNRPEAFGLPAKVDGKSLKQIMSLGRRRCCPDEVLKAAAPEQILQNSPVYALRTIRSQMQAAVNSYSFPFMNMCRAIPDGVLGKLRLIEQSLQVQFDEQALRFMNGHIHVLREHSVAYWKKHADLLKLTPAEIQTGIEVVFGAIQGEDFAFEVKYFDIKAVGESLQPDAKIEIIEEKKKIVEKSKLELDKDMKAFRIEMVKNIRDRFCMVFEDALSAIKSGKFNQKTFKAVLRQIDGFEALNVMKDSSLEELLNDTKKVIEIWKAKQFKKNGNAIELDAYMSERLLKLDKLDDFSATVQEFAGPDGRTIEIEPF